MNSTCELYFNPKDKISKHPKQLELYLLLLRSECLRQSEGKCVGLQDAHFLLGDQSLGANIATNLYPYLQ